MTSVRGGRPLEVVVVPGPERRFDVPRAAQIGRIAAVREGVKGHFVPIAARAGATWTGSNTSSPSDRMRTYVRMRWDAQRVEAEARRELPGYRDSAVVRTFDAPEALDTRFYEVRAKSALNRVPERSQMPFRWTVNPYRGCRHACNFCFARPTHTYLDLDAGRDFEKEIVVKVNAPEVLRAELARPRWTHEHVAMGTNTDPYQWVEGRYKLMPGILEALRDTGTPASVLTKSPLLLRDLELMRQVPDIGAALSVPTLEEKAWRSTEPHTPTPALDSRRSQSSTARASPPAF